MKNHLKDQTSPYLLQHAENPVHWYPWCKEAFERAKQEDKPVFLSIGYSTCHWCHVMAHESFEDIETAELLNRYFISIKVDKEERPDLDSIYMSVCQALTGSGGWPTSLFLTPDQKAFFAGTYFSKKSRNRQIGFQDLLLAIHQKWTTDRAALLQSADEILSLVEENSSRCRTAKDGLMEMAIKHFQQSFDDRCGGFGNAPKFPTPHHLLFLFQYYEKMGEEDAKDMAETTLLQMYRGGMFDHIGGGFCRYSTDRYFLVPHFEKMLYDNALLILAYSKAYQLTKKPVYRKAAEKTADYILREMTALTGGFYSAQDADSEGVEGKFYVFEPGEIRRLLGEQDGNAFNEHFDITEEGNFEGKSIPNLLNSYTTDARFEVHLPILYEYRKTRTSLHLDDKILTAWNGLMIGAMCCLYRVTGEERYLDAAHKANIFLMEHLCEGDTLFVSWRDGKRQTKGFLDDYANVIFAQLCLYEATLEKAYLEQAVRFANKVEDDFHDKKNGGYFLYGEEHESLILHPKETWDGAVPSGNSMMAYNLVRLHWITEDERFQKLAKEQIAFMSAAASSYPAGFSMFLCALSDTEEPPMMITIIAKETQELSELGKQIPLGAIVRVLTNETKEYPMKNGKTTFYICRGHVCQPPVNELTGNIG